jgi:hypothetical protein
MCSQVELDSEPGLDARSPVSTAEPKAGWNVGSRIGFRFVFAYLVLYCLPFPIGYLPGTERAGDWYDLIWQKVTPWVGKHLLRLSRPILVVTNGSGDRTCDYVEALCFLVLAAVAAFVWSVLERRRENHQSLHSVLRLYVGMTLGAILLSYGAAKVFPSQFPPPWQWRYLETYGDSSPMGILWTFMGSSKPYTILAGAIEMLAGFLLFVPSLTSLGALVSIGVLGNIFVLNMTYDVPVKLYSFHLLLMSVFLILPELPRLANVFIFNRVAAPAPPARPFQRESLNRVLPFALLALGLIFAGMDLYQSRQSVQSFAASSLKAPLYGTWAVDEFAVEGQSRPPLVTEGLRWQKAILETGSALTIQGMDGKLLRLLAKLDTRKRTIELTKRDDAHWKANLSFEIPAKDLMIMSGDMAGKTIRVRLHHTDPKYLLNTRGFHWINESPFNR